MVICTRKEFEVTYNLRVKLLLCDAALRSRQEIGKYRLSVMRPGVSRVVSYSQVSSFLPHILHISGQNKLLLKFFAVNHMEFA